MYPAWFHVVKLGFEYAPMWLRKKHKLWLVVKYGMKDVLIDVVFCRMMRWATTPIFLSVSLVYPDVVDLHLCRKL